MSKVLVIGCGGVASVAISKCCQVSDVFTELCIASRTKSKCDALAAKLAPNTKTKITTAQVDADDVQQLCDLINSYKPDLVMNIALPYQDLTIMDACLACGVNYMDTANYEPENTDDPEWRAIYEKRCKEAGFSAYFDYSWQWAYKKKFEDAGLTALLGCGFDPGVTQAYCAYAAKHEFDTIDTIDILDCNGGDHGYAFATNFNPEINLREVSAPGSYMENGKWVEIPAMSIKREYNFDQVGQKDMYLLHHEEIESLAKNIPEAKRIRFFMTFGQSYLDHMRCLEDVGMLSTTPVNFNGQEIVPIQFLKALLPDPASLGPRTKGKTNIGCIFTGKKDGKDKTEKATKKNETTTKKTTTTTTTVAANRKIHISVSLPAGTDTRTDKLRITINGKQVDEKKVTLEIGNTFTYTTEKKYRGDVKVQVELEHTQKSAKVTVKKGTDTAKFNFENIENLLGDDD